MAAMTAPAKVGAVDVELLAKAVGTAARKAITSCLNPPAAKKRLSKHTFGGAVCQLGAALRRLNNCAKEDPHGNCVDRLLQLTDLTLLESAAVVKGTARPLAENLAWIPVPTSMRKQATDLIEAMVTHVGIQQQLGHTFLPRWGQHGWQRTRMQ